jgi:hypothetical protein
MTLSEALREGAALSGLFAVLLLWSVVGHALTG